MKYARFSRHVALGFGAALALAIATDPLAGSRVDAQAPPPPPPAPNATPSSLASIPAATPLPSEAAIPSSAPSVAPAASESPSGGRRRRRAPAPAASSNPEPSATPTSPAFATLDGFWEVQVQYVNRTDYSYFAIQQNGTAALSGTWRIGNAVYPFDGTYDGRLIRLVVKEPARTVTLSGYVEGATDMVGLVESGDPKVASVAFTAEHRGSSTPGPGRPRKKKH